MSFNQSGDAVYKAALFIVAAIAIFWCYEQPQSWLWALSFAIGISLLIKFVFNAGRSEGIAYAEAIASLNAKSNTSSDKELSANTTLKAFQNGMAEVDLFAYELANDLIPDGYSESNPGLGPMDFNEWLEWKKSEFDRTGNLWHNHPGGMPPGQN